MQTLSENQYAKIEAAYLLLTEESTTFDKFEKVRTLISGINPKIDKTLAQVSDAVKTLRKIQDGEVIDLAFDSLPEETEEQKKRKKTLLLFRSFWKDLRAEVKRIKNLYESEQTNKEKSTHHHTSTFGKILTTAKGPLGIITISAVAIVGAVAYLKTASVSITIKNQGCSTITPTVKLPVSIPGIQIPTDPIADGNQGVATLPPFTLTVDGTKPGSVVLTAFQFTMTYDFPRGTNLIFNSQSLIGKQTTINLGSAKEHQLTVSCL